MRHQKVLLGGKSQGVLLSALNYLIHSPTSTNLLYVRFQILGCYYLTSSSLDVNYFPFVSLSKS